MKHLLYLFTAVALGLCAAACDSGEPEGQSGELASPELYFPRDQYAVDTSTGLSVIFEWASASTGNVVYQVLFDTEEGDFSDPVYVASSRSNGFEPRLELEPTTLTTIASLCGGHAGQTTAIRWTVRTIHDNIRTTDALNARTILVTTANVVDPLPVSLFLEGSASENQAAIRLNAALPIGTTLGQHLEEREAGALECFTQLTEGSFTLKDNLNRYYALQADGTISCTDTDMTENTAPDAGIYWIYLNFNTMKWEMTRIAKVEFWNHPWFGETSLQEMTYTGNGVWELRDFAWVISDDGSRTDTRYHFVATYDDGSVERWSFWDDDCRNNANPEGDPKFYNIYRFTDLEDEWAHSWKSKDDREGLNQLATFRIHMNNTEKADYYHERSFRDK